MENATPTRSRTTRKKHPEIRGLLVLSCSLILLLSLLSFSQYHARGNLLGLVGHHIAFGFLYLFGLCAYLVVGWIGWIGWKMLTGTLPTGWAIKTSYFFFFTLSISMLCNVCAEHYPPSNPTLIDHVLSNVYLLPDLPRGARYNLGGVPLYYLYQDLDTFNLEHLLSHVGVLITFSLTGMLSFILFTHIRLTFFLNFLGRRIRGIGRLISLGCSFFKPSSTPPSSYPPRKNGQTKISPPPSKGQEEGTCAIERDIPPSSPPSSDKELASSLALPPRTKRKIRPYELPPIQLLTSGKKVDQPTLKKDLQQQADLLEKTLLNFGIQVDIGQIHCGPTIASFEVHPPTGVKVQKIKVLENDIALNLQAKSVRIIAPIPGKAAVGVEVPSPHPQEVIFKEMLREYQKGKRKARIPILLGQTVSGESLFVDLTKMPHCIIAGATGSGKSVCINSMVMSILMTTPPTETKLLLIDPKKVELSAYTDLPHLIAPVITEAYEAYEALNWLVKEMLSRYEILKRLGLRNIHAFNHRKIQPKEEGKLGLGMQIPQKMFYLVAIIDEFADLMMASSTDLETPIARIAQMARAVGIHLVLATQRPSREVITGIIKANFPSRIAFKVSNRMNSQIILDDNGAESLLGNGDLLFMPPGTSQMVRAQGVYIRDHDINQVIQHIRSQAPPHYLIPSFDQLGKDENHLERAQAHDPLYEKARDLVSKTGTASTTFLQRKLKVGYARAASLIDALESQGVISSQEGSRPRRVFTSAHQEQEAEEEMENIRL